MNIMRVCKRERGLDGAEAVGERSLLKFYNTQANLWGL